MKLFDEGNRSYELADGQLKVVFSPGPLPDSVVLFEIRREFVRNAINRKIAEGLGEALDLVAKDESIRVIVLTGAGSRAFVSGGDLREFAALKTDDEVRTVMDTMRTVLWRLYTGPQFVIGALNGPMRGGGAELSMACHYRIACGWADIAFVQSLQGICPGWGGGVLLARQIEARVARQALVSGRVYSAKEAGELGFFDSVADSEDEFRAAIITAARMYSKASRPAALAISETLCDSEELWRQMTTESERCVKLWFSSVHVRAMEEFLR